MSKCPCCGSSIAADKVLVDLTANTLSFNSNTVKLTNGQADFAFALAESIHHTVPYDKLAGKVFGAQIPKTIRQSMSEYAHRLNRYIQPMGLKIICVRKEGYKMVEIGDPR